MCNNCSSFDGFPFIILCAFLVLTLTSSYHSIIPMLSNIWYLVRPIYLRYIIYLSSTVGVHLPFISSFAVFNKFLSFAVHLKFPLYPFHVSIHDKCKIIKRPIDSIFNQNLCQYCTFYLQQSKITWKWDRKFTLGRFMGMITMKRLCYTKHGLGKFKLTI